MSNLETRIEALEAVTTDRDAALRRLGESWTAAKDAPGPASREKWKQEQDRFEHDWPEDRWLAHFLDAALTEAIEFERKGDAQPREARWRPGAAQQHRG